MITKIFATDRANNTLDYTVTQHSINEYGYSGIRYMVTRADIPAWKYFEVDTLEVSDTRLMIYMLLNHDHPELTSKGIVKAMLKALSVEFKKDIVSSTNNPALRIGDSEGRIEAMTEAWEKWAIELPNVEYLKEEDRFIFHYVPIS